MSNTKSNTQSPAAAAAANETFKEAYEKLHENIPEPLRQCIRNLMKDYFNASDAIDNLNTIYSGFMESCICDVISPNERSNCFTLYRQMYDLIKALKGIEPSFSNN